jgi:hypothetical protein
MPKNRGRNSQHQQQCENGDADGADNVPRVGALTAPGQHRDQGEKQGKAQVLKQTNGHRKTAMGPVVLRLLGELRNDDGRGGHGHRAADHHGHRRHHVEQQHCARGDQTGGDQYLRSADAQHFPTHGHQTRQGELQPEREYQKHHAEVSEELRGLVVEPDRKRVRTQQHAHREIPEDGRQLQLAHARDHAHRCGEQYQDLQQRIVMHHALELQ